MMRVHDREANRRAVTETHREELSVDQMKTITDKLFPNHPIKEETRNEILTDH